MRSLVKLCVLRFGRQSDTHRRMAGLFIVIDPLLLLKRILIGPFVLIPDAQICFYPCVDISYECI